MKGRILIINPGSTSTKIGFYEDGQSKFDINLTHSAEEIAKYESVMHQGDMRKEAIVKFLSENGYGCDTVYPFDLFPKTSHVEAVVLLQQLSLPDGK